MAKLRWGSEGPADSTEARRRLIDAAERCFDRFGVMKTTVEDVADEAKVSRATVYRYFEGRDELILAVLMRHANSFLAQLGRRIERAGTLVSAIPDGVVYTVAAVRKDHNLALLFAPEVAGMTGSIAGRSEALFAGNETFLRPYLEAARQAGELRPGLDIGEASEWVLRVVLSLLTVHGPARRTEAAQRRYLTTFLVPALVGDPTPSPKSSRSSP